MDNVKLHLWYVIIDAHRRIVATYGANLLTEAQAYLKRVQCDDPSYAFCTLSAERAPHVGRIVPQEN